MDDELTQQQRYLLGTLERLLIRFPDLRLGQLIGNALPPQHNGDPYYITDEDLNKALLAYEQSITATFESSEE